LGLAIGIGIGGGVVKKKMTDLSGAAVSPDNVPNGDDVIILFHAGGTHYDLCVSTAATDAAVDQEEDDEEDAGYEDAGYEDAGSEEDSEEEEGEKEKEKEKEEEAGSTFSVDFAKIKRRLSKTELETLIQELGVATSNGSNEMRAAISELLKKLKDSQHQSPGPAPVVSEEEDAVADLSEPSNEGRCITVDGGESRVALLVSARSKSGNFEEKSDWEGPMRDEFTENLINAGIKNWPSKKHAKEAIWRAGGARDPGKPLLLDLDMEIVDYHKDDNWKLVKTRFDLDFVDATVPGSIAANFLCSELGNSRVSYKHRIDGVDAQNLRATIGDNVVLCMTHRDAARFQTFCFKEGGRLLTSCNHAGQPVRFFGRSRKSVPDCVLRAFLCQDDVFVRLVGYGMNMRLDVRGLTVLKQLRNGVKECKQFEIPPAWTTTEVSYFKAALYKPFFMDFSWVTPMDRVGEEGGEARVVLQRKIKGVAPNNQLNIDVYPVCGGDGQSTGTFSLRKVRSR